VAAEEAHKKLLEKSLEFKSKDFEVKQAKDYYNSVGENPLDDTEDERDPR